MGCGAAVAAVAAAAVSAGANIAASSSASGSAKAAANANTAAVKATNDQNLLMNLYSRGVPMSAANSYGVLSGGMAPSARGIAAAVLPYYFGKGGESGMAEDTLAAYKAANAFTGTPEQSLQKYQDVISQFAKYQDLANQSGANLFNGKLEDTLMANAQPVWDENIQGAETQIQAGFQALAKTLNNIDAIQAKKGFTGDTSGGNMLKFSARANIGQAGAEAMHTARAQNAMSKQGIQSGILDTQLSNINLPTQQAQLRAGLMQMPLNAVTVEQQNKQSPFAFFKMGQNQFQPIQTPIQGAIPGTGQIVGSAIGSLATGVGNIYQQYKQNQATQNALFNSQPIWNSQTTSADPMVSGRF